MVVADQRFLTRMESIIAELPEESSTKMGTSGAWPAGQKLKLLLSSAISLLIELMVVSMVLL